MFFQIFAQQSRATFDQRTVGGPEGRGKVTVNIEFTHDLTTDKNRDHDFRFGFQRTSQIPWIGVDVIHYNRLSSRRRSAADALMQRNSRVRGHRAHEGAQLQHSVIFGIEHIETRPVIFQHAIMKRFDVWIISSREERA
jgi:hypothetical protein